MINHDLMLALQRCAVARLESIADSPGLPAGVRILDSWRSGEHGAVLFWVDRELDLWGSGEAVLHHEGLEVLGGVWRNRGRGARGTLTASEILAEMGVGLHRLGGGSRDPVRLTEAIASPEVVSIELRSDQGVSTRAPGVDGFCLLGITHRDPITYARPLDPNGQPLGSKPLLL